MAKTREADQPQWPNAAAKSLESAVWMAGKFTEALVTTEAVTIN
jgi:hypothetical protein